MRFPFVIIGSLVAHDANAFSPSLSLGGSCSTKNLAGCNHQRFSNNDRHAHSLTPHYHSSLSFGRIFAQKSCTSTALLATGEEPSSSSSSSSSEVNKLDLVLSRLTSAFPLFVLFSAILAVVRPATLTWVNRGNIISIMLASVMCGTGLTLETKDFTTVLTDDWKSVPLGVLCQFVIMPSAAWIVGHTLLQPAASSAGASLFLGLCLVGCSPGGTASNLVALIAHADVALSVILTAISTIMAVFMTPLLVKLLVGTNIQVSGMALCQATARVVLVPVLAGMLLNAQAPRLARGISRFTPFASVVLVALICGGVVAQNVGLTGTTVALPAAVVSLHSLGFFLGYTLPKLGFGRSERSSRTISIEVGMQNSALAVVLARSIGAPALASLPGALSATAHSCLGSILAAVWRLRRDDANAKDLDDDDEESTDCTMYSI